MVSNCANRHIAHQFTFQLCSRHEPVTTLEWRDVKAPRRYWGAHALGRVVYVRPDSKRAVDHQCGSRQLSASHAVVGKDGSRGASVQPCAAAR